MLKIWGKILKNNKIIKDIMVTSNVKGSYQDNLKFCINSICEKLDIEKPYWLPSNVDEYNKRGKVNFDSNNFIQEIDFDKFVIEEINLKEV